VAALVRSTFLVSAVYAESARKHGLTPQQGQLLCVLMAQPYGMGELSTMLALAKSSLTGLVDRTERNGLVRRESDAQDSALAAEFYAEACRRIDKLAAGLSTAERDTLAGLLGRIVLDNKAPVVFLEPDDGARAARMP